MKRLAEFEHNIKSNYNRLSGFIFSIVKDNIHSDDILQKVCLTMWRKYDNFNKSTEFMAWACTIAKYEISNYKRSLSRCPVSFDSQVYEDVSKFHKTEFSNTSNEKYDKLQTALKSLDKESRNLLIAVYIDNQEVRELAREAGKAYQTYYNKLNLAKKKLKQILSNDEGSNN